VADASSKISHEYIRLRYRRMFGFEVHLLGTGRDTVEYSTGYTAAIAVNLGQSGFDTLLGLS